MNEKFGKIALWSCSKKLLNLRKRSKESLKLKAGIEQQNKVGYAPNVTVLLNTKMKECQIITTSFWKWRKHSAR